MSQTEKAVSEVDSGTSVVTNQLASYNVNLHFVRVTAIQLAWGWWCWWFLGKCYFAGEFIDGPGGKQSCVCY